MEEGPLATTDDIHGDSTKDDGCSNFAFHEFNYPESDEHSEQ